MIRLSRRYHTGHSLRSHGRLVTYVDGDCRHGRAAMSGRNLYPWKTRTLPQHGDAAMKRCAALPGLVLNVPAIALKSPEEVARVMGPPDRSNGVQLSANVRNRYRRGAVEIVFVEGRASWIKLYNTRHLPFSVEILPKLGLPLAKPTYVNSNHVMSWSNLPNLKEVSVYAGEKGAVSSILICVRAKRAA
jgi:hypothetical protein